MNKWLWFFICVGMITVTNAAQLTIKMYKVAKQGRGEYNGTVVAKDTQFGLLLTPHLKDLSPGPHGFHVHVNPSCGDDGMKAGGHLDPLKTNQHLGPYNSKGHLGDLPVMWVAKEGTATTPLLAPRLSIAKIENHSLMVHVQGDNYADYPEKLGGGGARLACGVIGDENAH